MGKLTFNITGLSDFEISFTDYCTMCDIQSNCKHGKNDPVLVQVSCNDFRKAEKEKKEELMRKVEKKNPNWDWDRIEKASKVQTSQIISVIWADRIKKNKEEYLCMDSRKTDSMLTSQRREEWWSDFLETMREINGECSKICY